MTGKIFKILHDNPESRVVVDYTEKMRVLSMKEGTVGGRQKVFIRLMKAIRSP